MTAAVSPAARAPLVRAACLLTLTTAQCGDPSNSTPEQKASWQLVFQELPGALISVAGTSENDVWLAGSDPQDGRGALVLHYDGVEFERLELGVEVDLWWVHAFERDLVFFGGADGTIVKYDGMDFTRMTTPGTGTIFGIWGSSPDQVWAVGGDPARQDSAFVWRLDGDSWMQAAGVPDTRRSSYFKVWGTGPSDMRIVGADGIVLHRDATGFREVAAGVEVGLTTVHASQAGAYVAVGGFGDGLILEDTGQGWRDSTPSPAPKQLFGVWLGSDTAYAVGANGAILQRSRQGWHEEDPGVIVTFDLHATWIDPAGAVWAVGGDLVSTPKAHGLLLYKATNTPAADAAF